MNFTPGDKLSIAWNGRLAAMALLAAGLLPALGAPMQPLNRSTLHLRSGDKPEWEDSARVTPDGAGVVLPFNGQKNASAATLFISQDGVKLDWPVELNGKKLGTLFLMEAPLVYALAVPPGALREGENKLEIKAPKELDDITVGPIQLSEQPLPQALGEAALDIEITDAADTHLPCRITVLDQSGRLAALAPPDPAQKLAVRPGVIYTGNGRARVGVLAGTYTVYVTRGFEWGLGNARVEARPGEPAAVRIRLTREVPTTGWVSSDTHIHTGTYARHGDATVEERTLTLAGEGIELPISTEHDCLVDFAGAACRAGVQDWFTPVIGDEVTTAKGHFNIFPVNFTAPLPDKKINDWPELMKALRATPGVQVVILNHPRNIHYNFQPFAATNFNAVTGENLRGFDFSFDAIEVANSSALQSDWMVSFRDWFALLNHGYHFTAVGSSDGHDVSRYIVGQGRTYIACDDRNPGRIDVAQACRNLRQGRALVSLGLLANMTVNDKFGVGDLATNLGDQIRVSVTVLAPSWIRADRVQLFANGVQIGDRQISASGSGPLHETVTWQLPRPKYDFHLEALATGPAVSGEYWAIARPYQPSSPRWEPRVFGITNPLWVDADGDGKFTSARAYAQQLVDREMEPAELMAALASYDEAVAAQAASVCRTKGIKLESSPFSTALASAPARVRAAFEQYQQAVAASR